MIQDFFNSSFLLELALILSIGGLFGILLYNFIGNAAERQRRALHRQRIQRFIDTADLIESATQQLAIDIPADIMQEILQQATIEDLHRIQAAIGKARAATQRLEQTHAGRLTSIAKTIGLQGSSEQPKQKEGGEPNNGSQNGANPEKAGRKMIGQIINSIKSSDGLSIEFEQALRILRDEHGINSPAQFAALSEDKRNDIAHDLRSRAQQI